MDNRSIIPILGVDTQLLDDQSPDGLCKEIINLKPRGRQDKPFWSPFEKLDTLKNNSGNPFTYTHGIDNIKNAFWQIRNRVNDKFKSTTSTSLERLLVLCEKAGRCALDVVDPVNWSIVKTLSLPGNVGYDFTATRIKEITVINITVDNQPYKIYYLIDDLFLEQGWPELPNVSFSQAQEVFSESEVNAGSAYGVSQDTDKYYQVRFAFKLYDGTYVRHSSPLLIKVDQSATQYAYMVPTFTMEGYESSLENYSFWQTQIAGVSCFASIPKNTIKEAVDEANFFELAFFPDLDKIAQSNWPTSENENIKTPNLAVEKWPLNRALNIDSFSHHRIAARVIDSYNQRLLIGGKSTDFSMPKHLIKGINSGSTINDFLDVTSQLWQGSTEYYDALGNSTTQGNEDYTVEEADAYILFQPKLGKEIKSSVIISSESPVFTQVAPHGETLPNVVYDLDHATYSGDNVRTKITTRQSMMYGDPIIGSMLVEIQIGPTGGAAEDTIRFRVTMGDVSQPLSISDFELISGAATDYTFYHQVKIITNNGEFERTYTQVVPNENTSFTLPTLVSYPDRRAVEYKCVFKNGSNYETVFNKKLIQHPYNNYSYALLTADASNFTFTIGTGGATSLPDDSGNNINSYNANEVQPSKTNQPFTFDASTVYRIGNRENDIVQGFAVNTLDISQGQFGQYPLYVLTNKSIWALEQSSDPSITFASIVPVDTRIGAISPHAITNADRTVIGIDRNYIYSLTGNNLERIDRPISFDADYKTFIANARVAYHESADYEEIIFSNPAFSYSWYYNLRFGTWYKGTESFKLFIQKQPTIQAINTSNEIKDFDSKITDENVSWTLKTRPLNFGDPYLLKRFKRALIRMFFAQENEVIPDDYLALTIKLFGNRDNHLGNFKIQDKFYKKEFTKDPWVTTQYGAFQTFEIEMTGQSMFDNSKLYAFECEYQVRQQNRIRR
ncbi:MAG: hypothetical protein VYB44_07080 [Bacteroidota bacterium]|nr:hypothetical protein [Bacteroidota bacterium]